MKKRVLSSIGIGGATVDTVLPDVEFSPGDSVNGTVELTGGDSTQEISGIYFALKAHDDESGSGSERILAEFSIDESVTLEPDAERTLPVEFDIPYEAPLTQGTVSVWLETGVDISWAVDPTDEDQIEVVPDDATAALFEAMDDLGFDLEDSKLVDITYIDDRTFAQKFDFRPTGDFVDDLDDLEITVLPRERGLRVLLEFDLVDEVADLHEFDADEQEISISFEHANAEMIASRIKSELLTQT